MAKTISVSDDVYEWMKKKKGERSFSEVIRGLIGETDFSELENLGISDNWEKVEETVEEASSNSLDRIEEEYA